MFDNLQEYRYPFSNCINFFQGYWNQPEALHLSLGWIFIAVFLFHLSLRNIPIQLKLAIPFFALSIFNNPAYTLGGINISESLGIIAAFLSLTRLKRLIILITKQPVGQAILLVFFVSIVYTLLISLTYPALSNDLEVALLRLVVNLKVLVLGLNLLIIGHYLRKYTGANLLIRYITVAGTFAAIMYLLQFCLLLFARTSTYGTFVDAGWVGVPSFGSVSIEIGHFGKFMIPLFPFFLYALIAWGWVPNFLLFFLVSVINFSSSSLSFFILFGLIALAMFIHSLMKPKVLIVVVLLIVVATILVTNYYEVYLGTFTKVYSLGIQGEETGGRHVGLFLEYLTTYPLGIGYGGSTLRVPPGVSQSIELGLFAFITQYSWLSPLIAACYVLLIKRTLHAARSGGLLAKTMKIGVLASPFVFATDILWFVPTIWLSYELIWSVQKVNTFEKISRIHLPRVQQF